MNATLLLPLLLALAVVLAWVRLLWRQRRTAAPFGQFAVLMLLQPVCAGLLYLTLVPPQLPVQSGTLSVLTAEADPARATGAVVVSLPEAPQMPDAIPVPDLATALRRHPGMALQVLGHGLEPRDRDVARGLLMDFQPGQLPQGLTHLYAPSRVAPGTEFSVSGRVEGLAGGQVRLLDPAGQVAGAVELDESGRFSLAGHARAPGLAQYAVQVLDSAGEDAGRAQVPVQIAADPPPRVLLLAGAPNPEFRHLRRWATDAGLDLHVEVSVGGGVGLGDGPAPVTSEGFGGFDLVIVDARALAGMGSTRRAALVEGMAAGLGVLVRVDGPLSPSACSHLAALGLAAEGEGHVEPVALAAAADASLLRARVGPGSAEAPFDPALADEAPPQLERRALRPEAADAVPLGTGADTVFAWWRAHGRGRVGLWTLTDSYRLALAGRGDLHAELWSAMASILVRPTADSAPWFDPGARAGTRMATCGLTASEAVVTAPDGQVTTVLVDPAAGAAGCAAYWPQVAGWHLLEAEGGRWHFHVRAAGEAPGIEAAALQEATQRLVAGSGTVEPARSALTEERRGPSWPWFLAWLGAISLLWWLERRRLPASGTPAGHGRSALEQD
ncbi:carboxypeptidase regulatory-like domain-containing protein [Luteimonas sp. A277]